MGCEAPSVQPIRASFEEFVREVAVPPFGLLIILITRTISFIRLLIYSIQIKPQPSRRPLSGPQRATVNIHQIISNGNALNLLPQGTTDKRRRYIDPVIATPQLRAEPVCVRSAMQHSYTLYDGKAEIRCREGSWTWHDHLYSKPPARPTPHFVEDILGLKPSRSAKQASRDNCEDVMMVVDEQKTERRKHIIVEMACIRKSKPKGKCKSRIKCPVPIGDKGT